MNIPSEENRESEGGKTVEDEERMSCHAGTKIGKVSYNECCNPHPPVAIFYDLSFQLSSVYADSLKSLSTARHDVQHNTRDPCQCAHDETTKHDMDARKGDCVLHSVQMLPLLKILWRLLRRGIVVAMIVIDVIDVIAVAWFVWWSHGRICCYGSWSWSWRGWCRSWHWLLS